MDFSESRATEEAVLIKENTKSNPVLSVQKGTTNNVSNLSELIIVLPVVEMTLICKKKKRDEP